MQRAGRAPGSSSSATAPCAPRCSGPIPISSSAGCSPDEALAAHYASADVFLFPSETETFGNVTLEAMASGLAVVAYDYAAARHHIAHGETGVLVPYGDHRAFVEAAAALARSPASLHRMRRQARAHAVAVDWHRVVERFEGLLTGRRRPARPPID